MAGRNRLAQPNRARALSDLGAALVAEGDHEQATAVLEEAVALLTDWYGAEDWELQQAVERLRRVEERAVEPPARP